MAEDTLLCADTGDVILADLDHRCPGCWLEGQGACAAEGVARA